MSHLSGTLKMGSCWSRVLLLGADVAAGFSVLVLVLQLDGDVAPGCYDSINVWSA